MFESDEIVELVHKVWYQVVKHNYIVVFDYLIPHFIYIDVFDYLIPHFICT